MTIVCGTDLGASGARAADVAVSLARALDLGVEIVHATSTSAVVDAGLAPSVRVAGDALAHRLEVRHDDAVRGIEAERARLVLAGGRILSARVCEGRPAEVLVSEAAGLRAQLVVVGPHVRARTIEERFVGSTADHVARHAWCPVVVATGAAPLPDLRGRACVVGVDGTPPSLDALRAVLGLAKKSGLVVHAVYVGTDPATIDDAVAAARDVAVELGAELRCEQRTGPPATAILEHGRAADAVLLAVGTHARSAVARTFLGSVSHSVLRGATVPVLLAR